MGKRFLACLCLGLCLMLGIAGCGNAGEKTEQTEETGEAGETGEVAVPQVDPEDLPKSSQTEEQKEAELGLLTEPGTVLGEEEVVLILEGEPENAVYTRIQGNGDFSIAYDPERFTMTASLEELRFDAASVGTVPVFFSVRKAEAASVEEEADRYVEESGEECTVEEVTVGEGEYPAVWVSYAEGTSADSRTCDVYVLRYNDVLYTIQMDCFVEAYEGLGEMQQMILSTLRFHEG